MIKSFDISFKDVDVKQGIVTGYFAAFNSLDSDGDIIDRGAFQKSIRERGPQGKQLIKWLLDHDKTKVIGKITDLKEDDYGLYYEGKIGRHTLGKDFLYMVEDGIINQHSFGYKTIKQQYDKSAGANILKELMMYEGSSIQFLGANQNTPITSLKSLDDAVEMCSKLEKFIHNSNASDETLKELSEKIKSLHNILEPETHSNDDVKPVSDMVKEAFSNLKFN